MTRHFLPAGAVTRARALRLGATSAERRLWLALREGLPEARFRRQVPIGPYIVDFCSHAARLVIEVDGSQHQGAAGYDAARTRFLEGEGYRVLRFWNNEVAESLDGVLTAILAALPDLPPRKRLREEQDEFVGEGAGAYTPRPPCGGGQGVGGAVAKRRRAKRRGGADEVCSFSPQGRRWG
jgi:very-short-patch-repair endonuclease